MLYPAVATRLEIACVCIPIFAVGYKAEVTNQLWMFVLEYLWVKMFQIRRTLIGEVVKTLQICYTEPGVTVSGLISTLGKMEVLRKLS